MCKPTRNAFGLFLLITGLTLNTAFSGEPGPMPVRTTWYVGKIGDNGQVQVELHVPIETWSGLRKVTGSYFYEALGERLELIGTIDGQKLELHEEAVTGDGTGSFSGDMDADDDKVVMTWSSKDGIRKLPVTLQRIADDTSLSFTQGSKVTISYCRPEFLSDSPLAKAVESRLRADIASEFASDSKFPADGWPKSGEDRELSRDENIVRSTIAYYCNSLISLRVHTYSDDGGAHGNEWIESRNFVLLSGKLHEMKMGDLFLPDSDYQSRLSGYCLTALREKQASFVVDGTMKNLKAGDMKAFVLGPQGITITFSPYAVASFAEGAFDVTIPWKIISDIVVKDPLMDRWISAQKRHGGAANDIPNVVQYDNNL